jgi:4-hydroxythreonine-4-phosphate dehydrogenase
LLCAALAMLVKPCADRAAALVATGGETARAVIEGWGINRMRLIGEVERGLPFAIAQGWRRPLPILTKAGAFGRPDTLLHCMQFLATLDDSSSANFTRTQRSSKMERPIIAITMGDAAGVGPEVIMKSLANTCIYEQCRPLVIGDAERLREAGKIVGSALEVLALDRGEVDRAVFQPGIVDCIDLKLVPQGLPWGKLSPIAGDAAYHYIEEAARLALSGKVAAICTAPLNKEALHAGGHNFPGHTELLAHLTGAQEVSMMLSTPKMKVLHVTTHIGLIDAIAKIEPGLVLRTIERGHAALLKAGIDDPRIGVCGINPHAGENGLFGYGEEETKIAPAIEECRKRGWNVKGPLPADTLFFLAQRGDFDLVVAMYHDQGHGPVKALGLESGVNITVGLPVIRTSVDHGTAFDIAGTGKVDERSMLEALRLAIQLAPRAAHEIAGS